MRRFLIPLALVAAATPAIADTRYLAFDASDRITTALTRGITLEVDRGLFGAVSVRRIISTSARGSASIAWGGPDEARRVLPDGAGESSVYSIVQEGDGRGLARALCPGSDATFLVLGRVRAARPVTMHAVGRWPGDQYRHCVALRYDYRGEWTLPPRSTAAGSEGSLAPTRQ